MAETELLPCPFCGGEARIVEGDESAFVQCEQVKMHRAIWFSGDNTAADQVREEWNTRRPAPAGAEVGVAVKPLEWVAILPKLWGADTALSSYRIHEHSDGMFGASLDGDSLEPICASLDNAKAAAQADFEQRIRSALVSPPVEPQGRMCERCQGNGEIVTDWDRYKHPHPGDKGDEAVRQCPDCDGAGVAPVEPQGEAVPYRWLVECCNNS